MAYRLQVEKQEQECFCFQTLPSSSWDLRRESRGPAEKWEGKPEGAGCAFHQVSCSKEMIVCIKLSWLKTGRMQPQKEVRRTKRVGCPGQNTSFAYKTQV